MSNNKETSLAWQMFGKIYTELNPNELRQYNRERKKISRENPELLRRDRKYTKEWCQNNREYLNKWHRDRRAKLKCQKTMN